MEILWAREERAVLASQGPLTRCREGDIMRCREMVRDTDHFCQRALFCGFFHSNMLFDMLNHIFDIVFEISIGGKMR